MQVKVIKPINGLEEGDILNYNEKTHKYEIKKIEEDISDSGYSSKKTLHTYSKNTILDNTDYFEFIDSDGDKIEVKEGLPEDIIISELRKTNDILTKSLSISNNQYALLSIKYRELERKLEKSLHWPFYSLI